MKASKESEVSLLDRGRGSELLVLEAPKYQDLLSKFIFAAFKLPGGIIWGRLELEVRDSSFKGGTGLKISSPDVGVSEEVGESSRFCSCVF